MINVVPAARFYPVKSKNIGLPLKMTCNMSGSEKLDTCEASSKNNCISNSFSVNLVTFHVKAKFREYYSLCSYYDIILTSSTLSYKSVNYNRLEVIPFPLMFLKSSGTYIGLLNSSVISPFTVIYFKVTVGSGN